MHACSLYLENLFYGLVSRAMLPCINVYAQCALYSIHQSQGRLAPGSQFQDLLVLLSPPGNVLAQGFSLKLPLSLPVSGLQQQIHRKDYRLLMDMFGAVSFKLGSTGTSKSVCISGKNKIDTEIPRPRGSRKIIMEIEGTLMITYRFPSDVLFCIGKTQLNWIMLGRVTCIGIFKQIF